MPSGRVELDLPSSAPRLTSLTVEFFCVTSLRSGRSGLWSELDQPSEEQAAEELCQAAVHRPRGRARLSLALYHRVAISNRRLIAFDETGVTFRYKDYRRDGPERQRVMTLAPHEFIRRFLLHVLPRGFHRIRHYGLLASSARKASIARARKLLGVVPPPEPVELREPFGFSYADGIRKPSPYPKTFTIAVVH